VPIRQDPYAEPRPERMPHITWESQREADPRTSSWNSSRTARSLELIRSGFADVVMGFDHVGLANFERPIR
jgi:hypothetical protein